MRERDVGGGGGRGRGLHNYKWYSRASDLPAAPSNSSAFFCMLFPFWTQIGKALSSFPLHWKFMKQTYSFSQTSLKTLQDYNSAIKRKDKVLGQPMEQSNEIKNLNCLQLFKLHTAKPMMGNYFWITYSKKHRPPFSPKFNLTTWFIYSIDKADWGIQLCWPIRAIRESLILNFGFSQINSVIPNPAYR